MAGRVGVDSGCPHVVVVVAWSVGGLPGIQVLVHLQADSERVEVGDAEDVELVHDGSAVCVALLFGNESDESLLHPYHWL